MATIIKEEKLSSIEQFNCNSCGNGLEVFNPRAKYISCQYCGSVLDTKSEQHEILMSMSPPTEHQPMSFIKVGLLANFFDKKYQVIARTRWQQDYYEYWSEEGETGYSRELWIYDEWLMISEQRTYFYLVEDKDGYYISEEIVPDNPSLPNESSHWSFMKNQRPQIINEYGSASVIYFEGESNYQIKLNDLIQFASYKHKNTIYTAEWRINELNNQIKEIEFFKEDKISKKEIIQAFENNEELDGLRRKGEIWQWLTYGAFASAILFFVLMFTSFGGTKQVFTQTFNFAELNDSALFKSKPIQLDETGLYCIELRGGIEVTNSEAFVLAYFLNNEDEVINHLDGDFSVYSGFDSDGYWTESTEEADKLVKVKETGTYHAKLMLDREDAVTGSVTLNIFSGVVLTRYYVIGWLIFLLLGFIFRSSMKKYF